MVTDSLPAATLLRDRPALQVIVLGGHLRAKTMATLDHWATGGVSTEHGLTCPDPAVAATKRAAF